MQRMMGLLLLCLATTAQAELFVIVNAGNPAADMTKDQVERLFMMKTKRFDNGDPAEPVSQPESSSVREKFNAKVLQRNEQQLKYYWSRKMFAGGDKPPPVVGADNEVESFVAANKGGIGYLGVAPKGDNVKVVLRLKD